MKLPTEILASLLRGAALPYAIIITADQYDLSPDAVVILLALAELHEKGKPTPTLEMVICQTLYPPHLFLAGIEELHDTALIIKDGSKVAATDKAAQLLKAVHDKCQQELNHRATRFSIPLEGSNSPLLHKEEYTYSDPLDILPLYMFSALPGPKPTIPKSRKQRQKLSSKRGQQG